MTVSTRVVWDVKTFVISTLGDARADKAGTGRHVKGNRDIGMVERCIVNARVGNRDIGMVERCIVNARVDTRQRQNVVRILKRRTGKV
nr:hypothetical protein BaRGS_001166 [Batillaria attramentaria]